MQSSLHFLSIIRTMTLYSTIMHVCLYSVFIFHLYSIHHFTITTQPNTVNQCCYTDSIFKQALSDIRQVFHTIEHTIKSDPLQ